MSQHGCRASRGKQDVKSENSAPISLEKICPECNKSVHIYDRTHYLVCKEEDSLAVQESFKRLLREHAARPPENKRNRWAKGGLRARYIANLRRKVRDLTNNLIFKIRRLFLKN